LTVLKLVEAAHNDPAAHFKEALRRKYHDRERSARRCNIDCSSHQQQSSNVDAEAAAALFYQVIEALKKSKPADATYQNLFV
jgi:hypothetical protein